MNVGKVRLGGIVFFFGHTLGTTAKVCCLESCHT